MTTNLLIPRNLQECTIFPCKSNSKLPATQNGFKDAKKGQDIQKWINAGYNVGLALSMSNLIAIDCDFDSSKDYNGFETLEKMEEKLGRLPVTAIQRTPRGGAHFIYSSKGIANPRGKIGKDIDIKYNGYIMLSPSSINGTKYEFVNGVDDNGFIFAELPQAWLDYLNKDTDTCDHASDLKGLKNISKKVYTEIDIDKVFNNCALLRFCRDNSFDLPEPIWHSMITVLAQIEGSDELIHELSADYPKYSYEETQRKIDYARKFGHPQSCKYLSNNYPEICANCPNASRKAV